MATLPQQPANEQTTLTRKSARTHDSVLAVQVTEVERSAWAQVGQHGQAEANRPPDQLAGDIFRAIEAKGKYPPDQRSELVLALSARRSPGHVQHDVIDAFNDVHAEKAARFGFRSIWLVGPTAALTYKLC